MFTAKQLERYADVIIWGLNTAKKSALKKNDIVLIRFQKPAVCLAEVLYAKLLAKGVHPVQRMSPTVSMERDFYLLSSNAQLVFLPPGEKELLSKISGSISLYAPESLTHLSDIEPKKISKATVAQKPLRDLLSKREASDNYSWTLCVFPTTQLAKHAGISRAEYYKQIVAACFLNKRSPVSEWQRVHKNVQSIRKWLNSLAVKYYHIESDHVDLYVTPGEQRKWIGISGRNIPSFEIFTSPDWRGTRGTYFADQPSYRSGNRVKGVKLEFYKGRATGISATFGGNFARKQLKMDAGANKLGEFSLTDRRFSKINRYMANTLLDENYGGRYGNCHIALGSSYSNTFAGDSRKLTRNLKKKLGFNDSALHWDLVNTEKKRVTAHLKSGKIITIYENGKFSY